MNFNSLIPNEDSTFICHSETINTEENSKRLKLDTSDYQEKALKCKGFVSLNTSNSTEGHEFRLAINIMSDD